MLIFDSNDLKMFMDLGKAFNSVTCFIYWFIWTLLMCLTFMSKQYDVLWHVYMMCICFV